MIKKDKYLEKKVNIGGQAITLFSLDGVTWSSIKQDLSAIQERYEKQTMLYGEQITVGPQSRSRIEAKKGRDTKRQTESDMFLENDLPEDDFRDNENSFDRDEYEDNYEDEYVIDEIDDEYNIPSASKSKGKSKQVEYVSSKTSKSSSNIQEEKKDKKDTKKNVTSKVAKVSTKEKVVTTERTKKVAEKKTPQKEKKVATPVSKGKTTKKATETKKVAVTKKNTKVTATKSSKDTKKSKKK